MELVDSDRGRYELRPVAEHNQTRMMFSLPVRE
jgi:hypothetical protein